MANDNDVWQATGFYINYPEGDTSLEREKISFKIGIDDKIHTLIEDDTITELANRYYGDPQLWYIIADVNDIENPLELETGIGLQIPSPAQFGQTNN